MPRHPSTSRFAILGALEWEGPLSGYHIRAWIKSSVSHFWSESFGQVYPTLDRLHQERLIEPAHTDQGPRRATIWRITAAGRAALAAWLRTPAAPPTPRLEWLLKCMLSHQDPIATAAHVIGVQHAAEAQLRALRAAAELVTKEERDPWRRAHALLTIAAGRLAAEARLAWVAEARRTLELDAESDAPSDARRASKPRTTP